MSLRCAGRSCFADVSSDRSGQVRSKWSLNGSHQNKDNCDWTSAQTTEKWSKHIKLDACLSNIAYIVGRHDICRPGSMSANQSIGISYQQLEERKWCPVDVIQRIPSCFWLISTSVLQLVCSRDYVLVKEVSLACTSSVPRCPTCHARDLTLFRTYAVALVPILVRSALLA